MTPDPGVGLPEALERAASALPADADDIRPANGDPIQLRRLLDDGAAERVLRWLLANEPAAGGQLADAWAEDPDCDPAVLLAVDPAELPKPAKKALRRARHRLRSRGVAVAESAAPRVVATIGRVEEELDAAAVTPLDPRGSRVVYLVAGNPSGGARIFEIMLDEERGVLACEVYAAPRGKARRFLREMSRGKLPAVEAPADAVRALVARVAGHQPGTRPLPRSFVEWRSRVAAAPEGALAPGAIARAALGTAAPELVDRAVAMIRERELGPWPPENPALAETAEKIVALGESELVVSAAARAEQVDGIVDDAIGRIFESGFAARLAERFEESAYVQWKLGRDEDARACLAAADAFRGELQQHRPLARAMLDVLLAPAVGALESRNAGSPDDSS